MAERPARHVLAYGARTFPAARAERAEARRRPRIARDRHRLVRLAVEQD
jgi:hypothetical protein